jgi:hypothetical protein
VANTFTNEFIKDGDDIVLRSLGNQDYAVA